LGAAGLKNTFKKTSELLQELAKANMTTKGSVFTMLYNPPFTPSFLRRNEVAIEVAPFSLPKN